MENWLDETAEEDVDEEVAAAVEEGALFEEDAVGVLEALDGFGLSLLEAPSVSMTYRW